MSIKIVCDGCADDTGEIDDRMWRTLKIDLAYLEGTWEHGTVDSITRFVLCPKCIDELRTVDLNEAIGAVFAK